MSKNRIEALSDGIFAIVLTLLVLEIKVPHIEDQQSVSQLYSAITLLLPKVISWVISFITVCVIWVNHHRLFSSVATVDNRFFWLNATLLMWCSFIPFPTALMGDYWHNSLAVSLYGVIMCLMALSFVAMRIRLMSNSRLLHEGVDLAAFRIGTRWSLIMGPIAYGVAAVIAWVYQPLAILIYALTAVYFVYPHTVRGAGSGR